MIMPYKERLKRQLYGTLKYACDPEYAENVKECSKQWRKRHPGYDTLKSREWRANNPRENRKIANRYELKKRLGVEPPEELVESLTQYRENNVLIRARSRTVRRATPDQHRLKKRID